MVQEDRWTLKELEMDDLRNLVLSYIERDAESSVPALERIIVAVKDALKENKDWLSFLMLPREKHPSPILSEEAAEPARLISYLVEMIDVIVSDFDLMKNLFIKEDPRYADVSVVNLRYFVDTFRSRMLEAIDKLVDEDIIFKKAEDLSYMIWRGTENTLGYLMTGLVFGFRKDPNPDACLEKLDRIEKCLWDLINFGRGFIRSHSFVPPGDALVGSTHFSESVEQGSGSSSSLVKHRVEYAIYLISLVDDCLYAVDHCDLCKLKKDQLDELYGFVTKIMSALEVRAFAEGGEYPAGVE